MGACCEMALCSSDVTAASSVWSYSTGPSRGDALSLNTSPCCDVGEPVVHSADVEIVESYEWSLDG